VCPRQCAGEALVSIVSDLNPFQLDLHHPKAKSGPSQTPYCRILSGDIIALVCGGDGFGVGKMEFGARALGHRSLLADPSNLKTVRKLNSLIKKRDFWMPFTPSVLAESYNDYVINTKAIASDCMTTCFDTTPLAKEHLKGAIHAYDHTIRPQKVSPETCPRYYALIKAFSEITGIGAILNTSLNMHEKPIVMKPLHLIEDFVVHRSIQLSAILIETTLYRRRS